MSNILMCGTNPIGQVSDMNASSISYNNTSSGLTADDVQSAIDEIASYPASKTFKVNRGYSHSSSRGGYWASMLNSTYQSEETAPTLPTDGKWWHVLSMDWMGDPGPGPTTNWCSQLALSTQDGYGVWWRRNDGSNLDIDSSTWHRLAEGDSDGNAISLKGGVIHAQATPWDVNSFTFDFRANVMYAITLGGGAGSGSHFYEPSLYLVCCRSNNASDVLQYYKIFGEVNLITGVTRAEAGTNKFTITINHATRNMIFPLFAQ